MCVAAKRRLQVRAATLLLLWAGFFFFRFFLAFPLFLCIENSNFLAKHQNLQGFLAVSNEYSGVRKRTKKPS